jgi:hypothetical protein
MAEFSKGDEVEWNTPQGTTHGTVVDERTKDFQLAKQHFTATDDEPMYIVESAKSGNRAAHKPDALTKRS